MSAPPLVRNLSAGSGAVMGLGNLNLDDESYLDYEMTVEEEEALAQTTSASQEVAELLHEWEDEEEDDAPESQETVAATVRYATVGSAKTALANKQCQIDALDQDAKDLKHKVCASRVRARLALLTCTCVLVRRYV